jgi:hypothetical protein
MFYKHQPSRAVARLPLEIYCDFWWLGTDKFVSFKSLLRRREWKVSAAFDMFKEYQEWYEPGKRVLS